MPNTQPSALMNLRTAVILLFALLGGTVAGLLTFIARDSPAEALLAAGATTAAAIGFLNEIIAR